MDWKSQWNRSAEELGSDPCKQVGRTWKKENYSEKQIEILTDRIRTFLQASKDKKLLDLACGNGMITYRIGPDFESIKAIDFSQPLIEVARDRFGRENIDYQVGDALEIDGLSEDFDCILIQSAFQFFNQSQADSLLGQMRSRLNQGGLVYLGEVADGDRRWSFYRGIKGKVLYYGNLLKGKRIIGYWWKPVELLELCQRHGFELSVFYQTRDLPNHYFRYDALLKKVDQRM